MEQRSRKREEHVQSHMLHLSECPGHSLFFSLGSGNNTECKECAFGHLRAPGENLSLLLFSCVI